MLELVDDACFVVLSYLEDPKDIARFLQTCKAMNERVAKFSKTSYGSALKLKGTLLQFEVEYASYAEQGVPKTLSDKEEKMIMGGIGFLSLVISIAAIRLINKYPREISVMSSLATLLMTTSNLYSQFPFKPSFPYFGALLEPFKKLLKKRGVIQTGSSIDQHAVEKWTEEDPEFVRLLKKYPFYAELRNKIQEKDENNNPWNLIDFFSRSHVDVSQLLRKSLLLLNEALTSSRGSSFASFSSFFKIPNDECSPIIFKSLPIDQPQKRMNGC